MVETYKFKCLSNSEDHKVDCHQNVRLQVLNHNNWISKLSEDTQCNQTENLQVLIFYQLTTCSGTKLMAAIFSII
jgi:hypothetical protein